VDLKAGKDSRLSRGDLPAITSDTVAGSVSGASALDELYRELGREWIIG
jgi:hypothetical protein